MLLFLVWFGIGSFAVLFVAFVLNLVRYARFPGGRQLPFIALMGATLVWLTIYTYALFAEAFVGPLGVAVRSYLGVLRTIITALVIFLVPSIVVAPRNTTRPVGRTAILALPAAVYAVVIAVVFTTVTLQTSAAISVVVRGYLWGFCLWGTWGTIDAGKNRTPRSTYSAGVLWYLRLAVGFFPIFAIASLPSVLLLEPSFFSAFPRSLHALVWAVGEIVIFLAAERSAHEEPVHPDAFETFGLTPREREIALLAVRGDTYKEIAEALYISVKTVETHLGNVYRKCGASGRDELRRRLRATPVGSPPSTPQGIP